MAPKISRFPESWTMSKGTLCNRCDSLRVLRWGDGPGLSRWLLNVTASVLAEGHVTEEGSVTTRMRRYDTACEDGLLGCEPQNGRKRPGNGLSLSTQREHSPADSLISAHGNQFWISDPQKGKGLSA